MVILMIFYSRGELIHGDDRVFQSNSSSVIIAGGHSLYFRNFFRAFLPHKSAHPSKNHKIKNGGAVAFTFCRAQPGTNKPIYLIEETSITEVFLGFDY
mmetsp:Transcript_33117/g.64006  ORF Transcript_33117/g.64006 Transcript_33117/m.64006 type:complete len:98 (-) Transcript_33117:67-360(-)